MIMSAESFVHSLEERVRAQDLSLLRDFVREAVISVDLVSTSSDAIFVREAVGYLDYVVDDGQLLLLATDVAEVYRSCGCGDGVSMLGFVRSRHRTGVVLEKVLDGTISRTGFLSFLSAARFDGPIKEALKRMSEAELEALAHALRGGDIQDIARMLSEQGWGGHG